MRGVFRGVPCPPYIVRGAGLQIWKLILASYNCHMRPDKDSYSNRPGSCLIAKSALTPCVGLQPGWLGRTSSFGWTEPIDPGRPKLSRKGIGVNTPTDGGSIAPTSVTGGGRRRCGHGAGVRRRTPMRSVRGVAAYRALLASQHGRGGAVGPR